MDDFLGRICSAYPQERVLSPLLQHENVMPILRKLYSFLPNFCKTSVKIHAKYKVFLYKGRSAVLLLVVGTVYWRRGSHGPVHGGVWLLLLILEFCVNFYYHLVLGFRALQSLVLGIERLQRGYNHLGVLICAEFVCESVTAAYSGLVSLRCSYGVSLWRIYLSRSSKR